LGTKENLEYIKEELSSEEKFLESLIKVEKFYKKYKKPLKYLAIGLLVATIGYVGWDLKKEHDLKVSNEAYLRLLKNYEDKEAINILKEKNPKLYELFLYKLALDKRDIELLQKLANSKDPIIKDLSTYHIGVLKSDRKKLQEYGVQKDAILRDFALMNSSYLEYEKANIDVAKKILNSIDKNSLAYTYSLLLRHYGVAK
jgi:hypothetical protein